MATTLDEREKDEERQMSYSSENEKIEKDVTNDTNGPGECSDAADLKRDSNGLPLVPQPSRFKDDPLVSTSRITTVTHMLETSPKSCVT